MNERILGIESEYAPAYPSEDRKTLPRLDDEGLKNHIKEITTFLVASLNNKNYPRAGEFLGNGGRFYIDRGGHPEYATPECRSIRDLVAHEKAGDRLVQELVVGARDLMEKKGESRRLHLFKNNVDFYGNTYGSHENYLITPQAMENIHQIIPFLVTRQIFAGAGKVVIRHQNGNFAFQLSQRSDFIKRTYSDRTSGSRGIINLRKREIPRRGQNVRLHIILGDSNLAEYAIGLKVGTTAVVLRLLEEGRLGSVPALSFPVAALKKISRDMQGLLPMERSSRHYTALDIQSLYLSRAQKFFASHPPNRWEVEIMQVWEDTLNGLRQLRWSQQDGMLEEDSGNLKRKIDWLLKLWLLNRYGLKNGKNTRSRQSKLLDFHYHDLDPGTGLFQKCRALNLVDRMVTERKIHRAMTEPPGNTRAWLRGRVIRDAMDKNVNVQVVNWEKINIIAKTMGRGHLFDRLKRMAGSLTINMEDPFRTRDREVLNRVKDFVAIWG